MKYLWFLKILLFENISLYLNFKLKNKECILRKIYVLPFLHFFLISLILPQMAILSCVWSNFPPPDQKYFWSHPSIESWWFSINWDLPFNLFIQLSCIFILSHFWITQFLSNFILSICLAIIFISSFCQNSIAIIFSINYILLVNLDIILVLAFFVSMHPRIQRVTNLH